MLKLTSIKVGYIVSYDYEYLLTSINTLYDYVDKIVLAIDINRQTWSGNKFEIPQSFFDSIKEFDKRNIIEIYFEDFYVPSLSPMECETRERNLLLKKLGRKGWKLQLDVDEYIYDFKTVKKFLLRNWFFNVFPKLTPMQFRGKLITLFKEIQDGFLYIDNNERFSFITNGIQNETARLDSKTPSFYTDIVVVHQSWARKKEEIVQKISNWGHRDDFDTAAYYDFWDKLNQSNYLDYVNIHPMRPELWNKLYLLNCNGINEFITNYAVLHPQKITQFDSRFLYDKVKKKLFKK
ncbi:hypothetical protein [Flavobacterium reichenbachii]|uniref:hypothetical protein n=1 Tax=Flavobacterium reichenbachii TaxID=362418 RepID=UPI00068C900B|nr:hypothetical protein [Flavobacterium reichenbachii]OXB16133.1 hypothetical protein B0A68_07650 [Flavobacterium reichenbachii]